MTATTTAATLPSPAATSPATASDPLDILLTHDHWATGRTLDLCAALTEEQFHRPFPIGLGSLHHNLTHMIGVMRRWADRIAERPLRDRLDLPPGTPPPTTFSPGPHPNAPRRTVDQLRILLADAGPDLVAIAADARRRGLEAIITVQFGPKTYRFTKGVALVHVCTHGMYHRAQCMNMLRHLGVKGVSDALPDIAVVDWSAGA